MKQKKQSSASVRTALYERGTTLRAWSIERGYQYNTVLHAVQRHADRSANIPWGIKTRAILRDLTTTTGIQLIHE